MKRAIVDLLELQKVDLRIRSLENKYKSIPAERAELVAEFEVVKKALAAAENLVTQTQLKIRQIETGIAAKKTQLAEIRLRSDSIKKVAEYDRVMQECGNISLAISKLEDEELEAMDALEKAKDAAGKAAKNYRATGRMVQKEVRELDAMKQTILQEVSEKSALSQELRKKIGLSILPVYQRLLASGKGEPLGSITSAGLCSNCSLKLPPMTVNEARKGNIVNCDNCSYLLYDPDGRD